MKQKYIFKRRYEIFIQHDKYFMIDMKYLSWLITIFPFLFYIVKYPIYEINKDDFNKIENCCKVNTKHTKKNSTFVLVSSCMLFIDISLKLSIKTSYTVAFMLNILLIMVSYFLFKKAHKKYLNKEFPIIDAKLTKKKLIFKFDIIQSIKNFIALLVTQTFGLWSFIELDYDLSCNGKFNIIYSILTGLMVYIIVVVSPVIYSNNLVAQIKE